MTGRTIWAVAAATALAASTLAAAATPRADGTITGTVKAPGEPGTDVVVFVENASGAAKPAGTAVLDQKAMQFVPHVLAVAVGTTVKFTNSDTVAHNVFSPDHEKYNLGTFGPGLSKDHTFAKCAKFPCSYAQLCQIHPEMEGFIVVVPSSYFATANAAGQFTIQGVPPGQYQVAAWSPKGKAQPKTVTVESGKAASVDFTLAK